MGSSVVDDEEDLRAFFEAVDEDKTGEISLDQFYSLFLGLGFAHDFMQKKELSEMVARAKKQRHEGESPSSIRPNTQDDCDDDSSTFVTVDVALKVMSQAKVSDTTYQVVFLFVDSVLVFDFEG
jgi:hypothetical protein